MFFATLAALCFAGGISTSICTLWALAKDGPNVAFGGFVVTVAMFGLWLAFALLAVATGGFETVDIQT